MKALSKIISTFFGVGYLPQFPGTVASALTIIAYYFLLHRLNWIPFIFLIIFVFLVGVYFSNLHQRDSEEEDPSKIVIDEVGGQLAGIFLVPPRLFYLFLAFLIFRYLDIVKPFSLKKVEALPGGWGVMVDDLVAGILTAIIMHLILIFV